MLKLLTDREVKARTRNLKHRKPDLTIFTDASCMHRAKAAGWGGWSKGDGRSTVIQSGKAPYHKNTALIELYAIMSMVEALYETEYLMESDKAMIIQSDSVTALGYLLNSLQYTAPTRLPDSALWTPKKAPDAAVPILHRLHEVLQNFDVVYLRHVRAHREDGNTRHGVNNLCDTKAKECSRMSPMPVPDWLSQVWAK